MFNYNNAGRSGGSIRSVILGTGLLLMALVVGPAATAQTPPDPQLAYTFEKFRISTIADLVDSKCERLTDVANAAAKRARDRYSEDVRDAGFSDEATQFEQQISTGVRQSSCRQLLSDSSIVKALQDVSGLVDEYLLVILRSGIVTCGEDFSAEKMSILMDQGKQAEIRLVARPDYSAVNAFAEAAGQDFSETCANPVVSSAGLIWHDPIGHVFFHAFLALE